LNLLILNDSLAFIIEAFNYQDDEYQKLLPI